MGVMLRVKNLKKSFTLHNQGGVSLPVLERMNLEVNAGECVVLLGSSGSGKSTFLRSLYSNYKAESGWILLRHDGEWVDIASAEPRKVLAVRKKTWVCQPVSPGHPPGAALKVIMEKLLGLGVAREEARESSEKFLTRLGIPQRLWKFLRLPSRAGNNSASISPGASSFLTPSCCLMNPPPLSTPKSAGGCGTYSGG